MEWISHVFNSFWELSCQHYLLLPSSLFYELPWGHFIWSLIHCKLSNSDSNPNFLLCNIHLCDIGFKLLASSEAFFHLSLHTVVILFVNLQGWCLALHQWYQSRFSWVCRQSTDCEAVCMRTVWLWVWVKKMPPRRERGGRAANVGVADPEEVRALQR